MHAFYCNVLKKQVDGQRHTGSRIQDPGRHRHNLSIPYVNGGTLLFSASPNYSFLPKCRTFTSIITGRWLIFSLLLAKETKNATI